MTGMGHWFRSQRSSVSKNFLAFWHWLIKPTVLATGAMIAGSFAIVLCTLALNAGSEDKTSDWISAFGTAFGAALTGGAFLVAALTYSRQVADKRRELEEKRREQAGKVIVRVERQLDGKTLVDLKNSTNLPIFKLNLYTIGDDGLVVDRQPLSQEVVVGDFDGYFFDSRCRVHSAYAEFTDSGGVAWTRTSKGTLVEKGKEPDGFDPREMWQPGDPMHTWETWY